MFDDDILGFYISVDNTVTVDIRDSFVDVAENHEDFGLCEFFAVFDEFIKMLAWAVLHDEVDVGLVVEEAIELDDVGVVQV